MLQPVPKNTSEVVTIPHGVCTVTVKANAGTCDILMRHDAANDTWVPATATITADGAVTLFPGPNARLKIVPTGAATWAIHGPGL